MRNRDTATRVSLLFTIFIFLICACAAPQKPLVESVDREATAILEKLKNERHVPDGMMALAEVQISAYGRKHSMRLVLVLKKPAYLRAESIPVIGTPDFFITLNDHAMKAYLPRDGIFYIGKPSSANLEKFIPLKLPVDGLAALLTGDIPVIEKGALWRMGSRQGDVLRIDGVGRFGKIASLWIDPAKNRLLKTVLFDAGADPLYTFYYNDFSEDDRAVPRQIQVVLEQPPSQLTIHYRDIQESLDETENPFDLAVPPAARTIYLD